MDSIKTKKMEVTDEEFEKLYNDQEFMKNVISMEQDWIEVKGDKIPVSGWVFTIKIN